eukprot:GHVR01025950.1.p1 GENE.GHVR01025950.1~~GHVR01025950.1.p1  ORF type:complete len:240 (-),score=41.22 GHVR01025950.1:114-833(-)
MGRCEVVPGLEEAVTKMIPMSKLNVVVSPEDAYGDIGFASVAPNESLEYCIDLISHEPFWSSGPTSDSGVCLNSECLSLELTHDEQLCRASDGKERGNHMFNKGIVNSALIEYNDALKWFDTVDQWPSPMLTHADTIRLALYLNISNCHLKLSNWVSAINATDRALLFDHSSSKAYFRRGVANYRLDKHEKSIQDMTKAATLDPKNAEIRRMLGEVRSNLESSIIRDKAAFQRMFPSDD